MKMHLRIGSSACAILSFSLLAQAIPYEELSPTQISSATHTAKEDQFATNVTPALFSELEELARIVDISYCVNIFQDITYPFNCSGGCDEFPNFELIDTFETEVTDTSGYIAIAHDKGLTAIGTDLPTGRIIVAFRGSISPANWVVNFANLPQAFIPFPTDPGANPSPAGDSLPRKDALKRGLKDEELKDQPQRTWGTYFGSVWKRIKNFFKSDKPKKGQEKAEAQHPAVDGEVECADCTVHDGFYGAYKQARKVIIPQLEALKLRYPNYDLHLVGHSQGGAIAPFVGLECVDRGWNPTVTTFGAPRIGNAAFNEYINERFGLSNDTITPSDSKLRRVTHVGDPIPHLPIKEWGYTMHAGEIFITKKKLPFAPEDLRRCRGNNDPQCSQGMDIRDEGAFFNFIVKASTKALKFSADFREAASEHEHGTTKNVETRDMVPDRLELWQILFTHRDYFWRVGICLARGDPENWYDAVKAESLPITSDELEEGCYIECLDVLQETDVFDKEQHSNQD